MHSLGGKKKIKIISFCLNSNMSCAALAVPLCLQQQVVDMEPPLLLRPPLPVLLLLSHHWAVLPACLPACGEWCSVAERSRRAISAFSRKVVVCTADEQHLVPARNEPRWLKKQICSLLGWFFFLAGCFEQCKKCSNGSIKCVHSTQKPPQWSLVSFGGGFSRGEHLLQIWTDSRRYQSL